ncbi:MAG: ribbon-helix-helix protein, CopG family [Nitrospirales bacterium]
MNEKHQSGERMERGRPRRLLKEARSHRVVTFVTDGQMVGLDEIAQEEGRSRSDVIHRIIAQHLQNMRLTERN